MAQYKVIPLACSGNGNRVFKNGDIVSEKDFPKGALPELIAKGFLREIKNQDESDDDATSGTEEIKARGKTKSEWKVVDMRAELRGLQIHFEPGANKDDLFDLLLKA